jgi:hypothetical protein
MNKAVKRLIDSSEENKRERELVELVTVKEIPRIVAHTMFERPLQVTTNHV